MTQAVRSSSISGIARGRIIGTHASTKETVISSSSGDSTEWRRMSQDSRSKWKADVDTSRPPVTMMINSSDLFIIQSIKRELKTRPIYDCRYDERLKPKDDEYTCLAYTPV